MQVRRRWNTVCIKFSHAPPEPREFQLDRKQLDKSRNAPPVAEQIDKLRRDFVNTQRRHSHHWELVSQALHDWVLSVHSRQIQQKIADVKNKEVVLDSNVVRAEARASQEASELSLHETLSRNEQQRKEVREKNRTLYRVCIGDGVVILALMQEQEKEEEDRDVRKTLVNLLEQTTSALNGLVAMQQDLVNTHRKYMQFRMRKE